MRVIESEIGAVAGHFDGLSVDTLPVAAASLGQVYKAKLKGTHTEVAIKVQRPDMLASVSLDLFLLRRSVAQHNVARFRGFTIAPTIAI